ncbi:armadillo repeat-containing protein 6 homolog [Neodiprion pinetum]|uniref:armadillo repeat-containing protein 6 homolog n=1 Tax=Neodiprion pinetum TaxID=441929 RepID=UPI001EE03CDF|nr:uncharacterized protein LOC124223744 [Neodiprion pinetum]
MGSLLVNDTAVKECLEILNSGLKSKTPIEVSATLERLNSGLSKSLESRMHAFQTGACGLILDVLDDFVDVKSVVRSCLKALVTLSSQSNELNEKGIARQMNLLQEGTSAGNSRLVMRWMKRCCLKSEKNRQAIFEAGVTDRAKEILQKDTVTAGELSDLCSLLRALILDDDLTIDYGNSVQRTRDVAQETVIFVVPLLAKFIHKKKTVCEVLKTLTALLVRNDFCVKVEEIGGVSLVLQTTVVHPDDENLTCLVLRLIKRLAGNDYVKVRLVVEGATSLVVSAMRRMQVRGRKKVNRGSLVRSAKSIHWDDSRYHQSTSDDGFINSRNIALDANFTNDAETLKQMQHRKLHPPTHSG